MDKFSDPLPDGSTLLQGQYRINTFLNDGGFGITYLASDSLDRPTVIKECFPRAICRRSGNDVGTRAISHRPEFRSIVKAFEEEARNLSKFEHPNIVKVHQVFDENQTAYMAMDYVEGHELVFAIEQGKLTPDLITSIALKLLDALDNIHEHGMLHRDISPDNILLDQDNNPVLIDFGAAKEEASQHGPKMTSIRVTKEGYSPQEFYVSGAQQFASSDLYALAATLYHAITGSAPPESQARLLALAQEKPDPYVPLSNRYKQYPPGLLKAINFALNVSPKDRLSSAKDWLKLIDDIPNQHTIRGRTPLWVGAGLAALVVIGFGTWSSIQNQPPEPKTSVAVIENRTFAAPTLSRTTDWSVDLPFTLSETSDNGLEVSAVTSWIDLEFAGNWIKEGTRMFSVNGQTLESIDQLTALTLTSQGTPFPAIDTINVTYIPRNQSQIETGTLNVYGSISSTFSNGMTVQQQHRDADWQLTVTKAPTNPTAEIRAGDILLAERVLGFHVSTLDELQSVLQTLEDRNLPKGVFSVRREGEVTLANLLLIEVK